jgi:hypothetical protein
MIARHQAALLPSGGGAVIRFRSARASPAVISPQLSVAAVPSFAVRPSNLSMVEGVLSSARTFL